MSENHVQKHVDLIAKHEHEFLARRTFTERLGDVIAGFAGSLAFVGIHLLIFAGWMAWNTLDHTRHFDPAPFSLLELLVALESLLLASFILMRQARMSRRADERDHLMLQILLLTEKEITAVLGIEQQIARHIGIEHVANSSEVSELSQKTSIENVAQSIQDHLPRGE